MIKFAGHNWAHIYSQGIQSSQDYGSVIVAPSTARAQDLKTPGPIGGLNTDAPRTTMENWDLLTIACGTQMAMLCF